ASRGLEGVERKGALEGIPLRSLIVERKELELRLSRGAYETLCEFRERCNARRETLLELLLLHEEEAPLAVASAAHLLAPALCRFALKRRIQPHLSFRFSQPHYVAAIGLADHNDEVGKVLPRPATL